MIFFKKIVDTMWQFAKIEEDIGYDIFRTFTQQYFTLCLLTNRLKLVS
jgi:hypothetical protein